MGHILSLLPNLADAVMGMRDKLGDIFLLELPIIGRLVVLNNAKLLIEAGNNPLLTGRAPWQTLVVSRHSKDPKVV